MRQFLLGKNVAYPTTAADYTKLSDGQFGIFVIENGLPTLDTTGEKVKSMANLVLGRALDKGGPVVIPINKRDFHFVKGAYQASTKFKATLTIPDAKNVGTYSIICVKKGKLFNDRHKWTSDTYVKDIDETGNAIAARLAEHINQNTIGNGLTATVTNATDSAGTLLTIEAVRSGEDYNIVPADELMGVPVTIVNSGIPAYGDAAYVTDLACKAAADAGFEYTFEEDIKMYPNYPLDPLDGTKAADTGFTIFTLVFFEGREVKNLDHVTRQVVQIALPTGATTTITKLESIFTKIAE